jgi:Fic/DOC family
MIMTGATKHGRLAGYAFLIEKHGLNVSPNWHTSSVSPSGTLRSTVLNGRVESVYTRTYWPGDRTWDHLEFALKYDGVNLGILSSLFETVSFDEITDWIKSKPTGKYVRKVWFLYEFLTGRELQLPDLTMGNYIELLEADRYFASRNGQNIRRQRIINNLLGGRSFCPVIRRTDKLNAMEGVDFQKRCGEVVDAYSPELLRRALGYLYNKETRSSFEIEHVRPNASRTAKFIGLLGSAERKDFCEKPLLIDAQNRIVDPRFLDTDYRTSQNYVGQSISFQNQLVHYVCPKPGDLPGLMDGLLSSHRIMNDSGVPAIIHAATISYGFVFLHPFKDGNGRIHRFLIHNILSLRGAIPKGLMFPVSAAMLHNRSLYDYSLELFSKPLMELVEYDLDELGQMTVTGKTGNWYRYIDMTAQAEALYDFVTLTVEHELVEELDFLVSYDLTKETIRGIVDMPDRLIDLFIRLCLQNYGRLSAGKRESHFDFLTDDELEGMEDAVRAGYMKEGS